MPTETTVRSYRLCNKFFEEWFSHCNSLAKTDLWATIIAVGGEGTKMSVVNCYPCPPTHPWRLPSARDRCYLLWNTHKHILPWTPFGFPYSPSAPLLLCCNNKHSATCTRNHNNQVLKTEDHQQPVPGFMSAMLLKQQHDIGIWINWRPERKHQADTEASAHTIYLMVKAKAGLLEKSQPTSLNIADHCLTIRWFSNKVLPKTEGSERFFFFLKKE